MPVTYPTELKIKVIRRYEKGESIKSLSQELHVSQSTIYQKNGHIYAFVKIISYSTNRSKCLIAEVRFLLLA